MIKNNISHFCQFSQNLPVKVYSHHRQWNMPSHMSLSFLRPQPAFEVGENDKKMTFHNFVHFSQNFQLLRSSFHVDSGEHLNRGACNCSDLSRHLKQVKMTKMTFHIFVNFLKTFTSEGVFSTQIVEHAQPYEPVISQTLAGI